MAGRKRPGRAAPAAIEVEGARTHNLKGVSCSFPVGGVTVVTGPSGSGKSSLAFDTLYAEGQRRFVESMSTYARQYLERLPRPDVERIEHILPAIAIEQKAPARSARSTVGTATEASDVLRLLYAAAGERRCAACGGEVVRLSAAGIAEILASRFPEGERFAVAFEAEMEEDPDARSRRLSAWNRAGLFRAVGPDGTLVEFSVDAPPPSRAPAAGGARKGRGGGGPAKVLVVVGRHVAGHEPRRLVESVEGALSAGDGALVAVPLAGGASGTAPIGLRAGLSCARCGLPAEALTPAHFSFNSPRGACEACAGFGRISGLDVERILPDPGRTLEERPITPFNFPSYSKAWPDLWRACRKYGVRRDVPWREMTEDERDVVWNGRGSWYGVKGLFDWLETKRYKVHVRVMISRFRGYTRCPSCGGARLKPEALAVRLGGLSIAETGDLTLGELLERLRALGPGSEARRLAGPLVDDLVARVGTLVDVGLDYVTLSRTVRTLSGGEAQRVQLGAAIGASLTGTLYVLDEPTVGLHPLDTARLLAAVRRLADRGNAVVLVEHDLEVIRAADRVVDLGPGAGRDGGELVFAGTPAGLRKAATATGRALRGEGLAGLAASGGPLRASRVSEAAGEVRVVGARANNLRGITVGFPLGGLVGVCGVSGSGKSSLVVDVLAAGARRALGGKEPAGAEPPGEHDRIEGLLALDEVLLVDQSPLGRSARSNPATMTKAWDEVRGLLSRTPAARKAGFGPGRFSFNAPGGRCETCEGSGSVTVDMQFLADVEVVCDACDGRRFRPEVLEVRLRGRNVDELLETTVEEALDLFAEVPALVRKLTPLADAGLSYLRLGQSTATLSGGEAQRLKIAARLAKGGTGKTLFLFDEPTTGLHPADVSVLLVLLRRLVAAGHSVVAVEHDVPFLLSADHLVELGPGAGARGGEVVFEGPPAEMAARGATPTAGALRRELASRAGG